MALGLFDLSNQDYGEVKNGYVDFGVKGSESEPISLYAGNEAQNSPGVNV